MATFHLMTHKGKWVRGTAKAAVPRSWEKERKMRKFLFTPTTQSDETDADYRNICKILIKQAKEQVTLKVPAMFCSCTSYHSNGNIKLNTEKYTPSAYLTFAIYFSKSPHALTNVKYIYIIYGALLALKYLIERREYMEIPTAGDMEIPTHPTVSGFCRNQSLWKVFVGKSLSEL